MKKIAFIIGHLTNGGAERVVTNLANELCKKFEVTIVMISGREISYELDRRVKIEILLDKIKNENSKFKIINKLLKLRKVIKINKFDIVVSFMTYINMYTIIASLNLKSKLIISERNFPDLSSIGRKYKKIRNFLYDFADGYVFQTTEAAKCFSKKIVKKSTIIGNPIKEALPINNSMKRKKEIISFGRLDKQKNHRLLINAFLDLNKMYPEYILKIYGTGPLEQELNFEYKEHIKSGIINFKGFSSNIHEEILECQMFVLSSDYEGMPNALMEAMAIGLPSISTNSIGGGAKEVSQNGMYAILTETNNRKMLTSKMKMLIEDEKKLKFLSNEGSKFIHQSYNKDKIVNKWIEYFNYVDKYEGKYGK